MREHKVAKVISYDEVLNTALTHLNQLFKQIELVKVENIYMEPQWENSLWVVNLLFVKKRRPFYKRVLRASMKINPINGEVVESRIETVK